MKQLAVVCLQIIAGGVGYLAYDKYQENSKLSEFELKLVRAAFAQGLIQSAKPKQMVVDHYTAHAVFPDQEASQGILDGLMASASTSIEANTGAITYEFGHTAPKQLSGGSVTISPTIAEGVIRWTCSVSGIDDIYLPAACVH